MVQQAREQWLGGRHDATTIESGLAFPDNIELAEAYGFRTISNGRNGQIWERIRQAYGRDGPVICNIEIRPEHCVIPQVKFGGPIEDGEPLRKRSEFFANMIASPGRRSECLRGPHSPR